MAITAAQIKERLLAGLPGATVEVEDTTGAGDHFAAVVVAPGFAGQSLVDRHRAVYAALGGAMHTDIHALALTTLAPDEKERR
jgi:stress-induced morphogen